MIKIPNAICWNIGFVGAIIGVLALAGCGGSHGVDNDNTALLRVALTDVPEDFASVLISIREIRVVPGKRDGEETDPGLPLIPSFVPPLTVNILDLQFRQQLLGEAYIPVGTYNQVRLVLDPNLPPAEPVNYVTYNDDPDTKVPLTTPSGQESGLKIVGRFEVNAGKINAIVLDFDPAKAIVEDDQSGQPLLKPTGIRIVQVEDILLTYGSISGVVMPEGAWQSAVVSVIPEGQVLPIAKGSVDPDSGSFRAAVPAGTYYILVTADGFELYSSLQDPPYEVTIGAEVEAGEIVLTPS